jgi:hypothetical protein
MLWMAGAYAMAAEVLCDAMVEGNYDREYTSSRVVLHLCRHATELFLKGAISSKTNERPRKTHRLERLYAEYKLLYPREKYQLPLPFPNETIDYEHGLFPGSLEEYQRTHDQRFRYPIDTAGNPFLDHDSFDVVAYQKAIERFRSALNLMVARIAFNLEEKA